MDSPIDPLELMAYADGELPPARAKEVRAYLETHPDAARWVAAQRDLGHEAEQCLRGQTPPAPRSLRDRIEQMPVGVSASPQRGIEPPGSGRREATPVVRRRRRLLAAAVVAILAGCAVVVALLNHLGNSDPSNMSWDHTSGPVPAKLASDVRRVHLKCSSMINHFYSSEFPRELSEVPGVVAKRLAGGAKVPDLRQIGYEFAGAGPCNLIGGQTVHILYRRGDDRSKNVSLFIQRDRGQVKLDEGKAYVAPDPDRRYLLWVWREGALVYLLTGDEFEPVEATAKLMSAPAPI